MQVSIHLLHCKIVFPIGPYKNERIVLRRTTDGRCMNQRRCKIRLQTNVRKLTNQRVRGREKKMSESTIPTLSGTRFTADYFGRETTAMMSGVKTDGMLTTFAVGLAALSAICLLLMCLLEDPWLVGLAFVVTYGLFWTALAGNARN